ncbi:hypothetical protein AM499_08910 [Bacillus sp. FJAT-22090]|uniref:lanthionine synthetase C family protein n=1 Tax=Bacillus sp. FJAT-22090 TaxID=1581038 RepID=UPI0006AFD804|nr:lanthionine synthetase C family protein [Bacillus sp. FJAT-22090]ALC85931.1 hypothetical protein AM499_08910 [Bacillus sp. FJAT-22090]
MIDIYKINNIYNLEDDKIDSIMKIINDTYTEIESDILLREQVENLDRSKLLSYAIFLGEIYNLLNENNRCDEIIFVIVKEIKKRIETGNIYDANIYNGLGHASIAMNIISKNTGNYKNFNDQVEHFLIEGMISKLNVIFNVKRCKAELYDIIMGVSGWMLYLIEFSNLSKSERLITSIQSYILELIEDKDINGHNISGWYVKSEDLPFSSDREMFSSGYFNFGISHGIAGILLALSISYNKGIKINNHKDAILKLVAEFDKTAREINNLTYWPGILTLEEYMNNKSITEAQRNSWCYGNVGILCSLQHAAKALDRIDLLNLVKDQVNKIAILRREEHLLNSTVICHGYSGLILLFEWYNKIEPSDNLINSIKNYAELLIHSYDLNPKYAFFGIDHTGKHKEEFAVLDGPMGSILTLITLIKNDSNFQKNFAFI